MFIPGGCFCCEPPADPCNSVNCTWTATEMSDTDVEAYDVTVDVATSGAGDGTFTITNTQDSSTGNSSPCRKMVIDTTVAPTSTVDAYSICWKKNATHNPATQCPLTNVIMCVESKKHSDSSQTSYPVYFFVRQGGLVYRTVTTGSMTTNWKRFNGTFTSSQFEGINFTGTPNFTASGSALEFGFGYKARVAAGATDYAEVRFDNFCITLTKNCGTGTPCDTSSCDVLNTGTEMTVDSSSGGGAYSVDSSDGLPAGCHKFTSGITTVIVSSDLFSGNSCQIPSSFTVCQNYKVSVTGSTDAISYTLRQGSVSVVATTLSFLASNTQWNRTTKTYTFPTPDVFDFSQPIELLLRVTCSGSNRSVLVDNICVKVTYGCRCVSDPVVTFSGLTVSSTGMPSLCSSAVITAINNVLGSALVFSDDIGSSVPCLKGIDHTETVSGTSTIRVFAYLVRGPYIYNGPDKFFGYLRVSVTHVSDSDYLDAKFTMQSADGDCCGTEVLTRYESAGSGFCLSWNSVGSTMTVTY